LSPVETGTAAAAAAVRCVQPLGRLPPLAKTTNRGQLKTPHRLSSEEAKGVELNCPIWKRVLGLCVTAYVENFVEE
jgi:hypothetical protein